MAKSSTTENPAKTGGDSTSGGDTEDITTKVRSVGPDEPPADSPSGTEYVEYVGKATTRRITEAQWRSAGVKDQGDVQWSDSNNFRVQVEELTNKALQVLRNDGSFRVPADR